MSTQIEWTDETWNPAVGCERVSPGCDNEHSGALGLGPRAEQVEKFDRDLLAERWGTCSRCGGPCSVAVRRWGTFEVAAPRLVRVCVDCGRSAGEVDDQEPEE